MFQFSFVTLAMIAMFVMAAWSVTIVAGARILGGAKTATVDLGVGPPVFDLRINRFRYTIRLLQVGFSSLTLSDRRHWNRGLAAGIPTLLAISLALATSALAVLSIGGHPANSRVIVTKAVTDGSPAALAGVKGGDTLLNVDVVTVVSQLSQPGTVAHFPIFRQGARHEVVVHGVRNEQRLEPVGLKILEPFGQVTPFSVWALSNPFQRRAAYPSLDVRPSHHYGAAAAILAAAAGLAAATSIVTLFLLVGSALNSSMAIAIPALAFSLAVPGGWTYAVLFGLVAVMTWKHYARYSLHPLVAVWLWFATTPIVTGPIAAAVVTGVAAMAKVDLVFSL